jgi:hypothetical protein
MPNLDDLDYASLIVHRVDDSVGTLTDAIVLRISGEFLTTAWAGSLGKRLNAGNDANSDGPRLNGFELLGGRSLDKDAKACHAAEGP